MDELTGFQRDCLYVVGALEGAKGLAVKAELDEYYGSPVNHGRLYPNLDALVDAGLVLKERADDRTNAYSLTEAGWEALAERREWENQYVDG